MYRNGQGYLDELQQQKQQHQQQQQQQQQQQPNQKQSSNYLSSSTHNHMKMMDNNGNNSVTSSLNTMQQQSIPPLYYDIMPSQYQIVNHNNLSTSGLNDLHPLPENYDPRFWRESNDKSTGYRYQLMPLPPPPSTNIDNYTKSSQRTANNAGIYQSTSNPYPSTSSPNPYPSTSSTNPYPIASTPNQYSSTTMNQYPSTANNQYSSSTTNQYPSTSRTQIQTSSAPMQQNIVQRISSIIKSQLPYLQKYCLKQQSYKSRSNSRQRSRDKSSRSELSQWMCHKCSFPNYQWRQKCKKCSQSRPLKNFTPGPDDWKCSKCSNINYARRRQCNRCRNIRK